MTTVHTPHHLLTRDYGLELSLTEQAYRLLERLIVTLQLEPGTIIIERKILELTAMGRTPVREALQRLAWEGLLIIRPRSGIEIATLHRADFEKVLDAREGIEQVLAANAARLGNRRDFERLNAALDMMREAADNKDVVQLLDADKSFDAVLSDAACNPYAARLASPLQTHSRRFWYELHTPKDVAISAVAHTQLIEAIISGDPHHAATTAKNLITHLRAMVR